MPQEVVDAMKGGAVDFLVKPFNRDQLVAAVDRALKQDATQRDRFVRLTLLRRMFESLTEREREIFHLVLLGHANMAIGDLTGIQPGTVKKHRAAVYEKFAVENTAELIDLCQGMDIKLLEQLA